VNSVVYEGEYRSRPCAVKGLIMAPGPFRLGEEARVRQEARNDLVQPPHSPHLLRFW
jgi:hypothetical protein